MNKIVKVLALSLVLTLTLVGCGSKPIQPVDGFETIDTHETIVSKYDDIESGHSIYEYSGEDFKEIIQLDQKLLVFIGRPT